MFNDISDVPILDLISYLKGHLLKSLVGRLLQIRLVVMKLRGHHAKPKHRFCQIENTAPFSFKRDLEEL